MALPVTRLRPSASVTIAGPAARDRFDDAWLCDLAGRLIFAHRLAPALFGLAVGLTASETAALASGRPVALTGERRERLELAVNIVLRLEWRLRADTAAMHAWLATPNAALGDTAPIDAMAGGNRGLARGAPRRGHGDGRARALVADRPQRAVTGRGERAGAPAGTDESRTGPERPPSAKAPRCTTSPTLPAPWSGAFPR